MSEDNKTIVPSGDEPDLDSGSPDELRRFAALLRLRAESYAHVASSIRTALTEGGLLSGQFARETREEGVDLVDELTNRQAHRTALLAEHLERSAARLESEQGRT